MSYDAPNHEENRREKRQANLPNHAKINRNRPRCDFGFSLNFSPSNNRDKTSKSLFMTKEKFHHSNECCPSSQLLLQQNVSSGAFTYNRESQSIVTALLEIMRYEDHVDSKKVRNILKEVFPEVVPLDLALIENSRARSKKMMVVMERDKHGKLNNFLIVSVEESATLMKKLLNDSKNSKLCVMELSNPEIIS